MLNFFIINILCHICFLSIALAQPTKTYQKSPSYSEIQEDSEEEKRIQRSQELVVEGTALINQKNYQSAILKFEEAQRLYPTAPVALMIARLYSKNLFNCQKMLEAWESALLICDKEACDMLVEMQDKQAQAIKQCGVNITIETNVPAVVYENNKEIGKTPIEFSVVYGSHFLSIKPLDEKGYSEESLRLSIDEKNPNAYHFVELKSKSFFSIFDGKKNENQKENQGLKQFKQASPIIFFAVDNTVENNRNIRYITLSMSASFLLLGGYYVSEYKDFSDRPYLGIKDRKDMDSSLKSSIFMGAFSIISLGLYLYTSYNEPPRQLQSQSGDGHRIKFLVDRLLIEF